MKKTIISAFLIILIFSFSVSGDALYISVDEKMAMLENQDADMFAVDASVAVDAQLMTYSKSVVLMEKSTGKVLYSENENEKLYPASVTKIMTILLVCEAIESDKIKLSVTAFTISLRCSPITVGVPPPI